MAPMTPLVSCFDQVACGSILCNLSTAVFPIVSIVSRTTFGLAGKPCKNYFTQRTRCTCFLRWKSACKLLLGIGSFLSLYDSTSFQVVFVYREGSVFLASVSAVSSIALLTRSHSEMRVLILSRRRILRALKSSSLKSLRNHGRGAL